MATAMAMAMVIMAISKSSLRYALLVFMILVTENSPAVEGWELTPRLQLGTIFTDNVDRDPPGDEESDLVFEVAPGFKAVRQGRRLEARVDYTLRNRLSLLQGRHNIENFLRAETTAELYRDHFFFEADALVTQVALSADEPANTDSVFSTNRTEAGTYSLNPYWIGNLGRYAESELRYRYSDVFFGSNAASNSRLQAVQASLNNGPYFTSLRWQLSYRHEQQDRRDGDSGRNAETDGDDDRRDQAQGELEYRLTRQWAVLGLAGYENNSLATDRDTENGAYWAVGLGWRPNRYAEAAVLYGQNVSVFRARLNPTTRTTLEVERINRDVGVEPGVRWAGSLTHKTRFSSWSIRYFEEVTNVQRQLANAPRFDENGEPLPSPTPDLTLRDETFLQKRLEGKVDYRRGRTGLTLTTFNETREFAEAADDEQLFGSEVTLSRRLAPRTNARLSILWEHTEADDNSDEWATRVGVNHQFSTDLSGNLEYGYFRQDSDDPANEYQENRITMRLNVTF